LEKFLIFILLIAIQSNAIAQTDSTTELVDTVYVKSAPVLIKKTFYLPPETFPDSLFYIRLGAAVGNQLASSSGHTRLQTSFHSFSAIIGKQLHAWSLSAGISLLNARAGTAYSQPLSYDRQRSIIVKDTIENFDQTVDGVTTTTYITRDRDSTIRYQEIKDTTMNVSHQISYIQLPVHLQYTFRLGKWFVAPELGILPGFALGNTTLIPGNKNAGLKKVMFMAGLGLHLGRQIIKNMNITVFSEISKNITPVTQGTEGLQFIIVKGGITLNYFF
jgi:hypothetical protein